MGTNKRIEIIEKNVKSIINQNLEFVQEYAKNKPDGFEKTLFLISVIRLKASFEAAILLMNNGYFVELSSIFRLIVEQLSWGCYLCSTDEIQTKSDINKLKSPQQTISYLKSALQSNAYGQLYGMLSAETHLPVKEIMRYLNMGVGEGGIEIILQSGIADKDEISLLLLLTGIYTDVVRRGIKRFGFADKIQEDEFTKRYDDWHKGVVLQLSDLMLSNEPQITVK